MKDIGSRGGHATKARWETPGFTPDELPPLLTLEDAKVCLDAIRRGILTRTITHAEGNAASKAVSEWCKAESAALTQRLVGELERELQDKTREIEELRSELAGGRSVRVAR